MKRNIILAALTVLIVIATQAPANLLRFGFTQIAGVNFIQPQGTIWQGNGVLIINPGISANLSWQLNWQIGESLTPTIKWQLTNPEIALTGKVTPGLRTQKIDIQGNFTGRFLEPILAKYDISIPGVFEMSPTQILLSPASETTAIELVADSQLFWSGGNIRYVLGNGLEQAYVPGLTSTIKSAKDTLPIASIALTENSTGPLLTMTPDQSGYVNIEVSRGFIELMGRTWTGSAKYSDVVLEIKRKGF